MRSFCKRSIAWSASLLCAAGTAWADNPYGAPSLLPLPTVGSELQAASYGEASSSRRVKYAADPVPAPPADVAPTDLAPTQGPAPVGGAGGPSAAECGWTDDDSCGGCCAPSYCCNWFGSFGALVMNRDKPNPFWTSYETGNNPNQVLNTRGAKDDWQGGWETTIGYWFGCCNSGCNSCDSCNSCNNCCNTVRYGLGVTYWGLADMNGYTSIRGDSLPAGTVSTPIDVTNGNPLIGGVPAAAFFDNATEHRIWREDSFQNAEINFLSQSLLNTRCSQITWLAGFRYLHFGERLTFGSVAGGSEFGDNTGANVGGAAEAYLSSHVTNNMFGFQIGGRGDYFITQKFGVYIAPKIGLLGNDINVRNTLNSGTGAQGFDISGSKNGFAMLGELDAGMSYQFSARWRGYLGYRVLGVTNVALGDNQFLPFLADAGGFADVKDNGSLILHGATAGLQFCF